MDEFIYCYVIQKWDYSSHSYFSIPITSREPLNIKTYSEDMNEIVNCCQCLKKVKFEDTYTSNEIHTDLGFGFAVCEDCYKEEWKRRKYYENLVRLSEGNSSESE